MMTAVFSCNYAAACLALENIRFFSMLFQPLFFPYLCYFYFQSQHVFVFHHFMQVRCSLGCVTCTADKYYHLVLFVDNSQAIHFNSWRVWGTLEQVLNIFLSLREVSFLTAALFLSIFAQRHLEHPVYSPPNPGRVSIHVTMPTALLPVVIIRFCFRTCLLSAMFLFR